MPCSAIEPSCVEGDLADPAIARARRRRNGLRAPPGGDPLGAAVGAGPGDVEPRERRRDAAGAACGARRLGAARRLRRLVVGVRRHADAAEARGHADASAVAVRAAEARRRAVHAAVHVALRPRDGEHPLLQRLRPAAGSLVAVLRRDRACSSRRCWRARRRPSPATAGRRATSRYIANVVDGVLRAATAPDAAGEVINVATGRQISIAELARTLGRHHRRRRAARAPRGAPGRRAPFAGRHLEGEGAPRLRADRGAGRGATANCGVVQVCDAGTGLVVTLPRPVPLLPERCLNGALGPPSG